jgi:hypothetical protein
MQVNSRVSGREPAHGAAASQGQGKAGSDHTKF